MVLCLISVLFNNKKWLIEKWVISLCRFNCLGWGCSIRIFLQGIVDSCPFRLKEWNGKFSIKKSKLDETKMPIHTMRFTSLPQTMNSFVPVVGSNNFIGHYYFLLK
ncbi:hypothetical protein C5469_18120 [Photorhabdus cinerea]|uniref:Uncharacterized protein n=1 Tax=Photorhabdus cinerea TaxID=471575 RepID=A0A7X5QGP1_9GAMM|nr:hypothetical protein [Photorhabdus cinerea]